MRNRAVVYLYPYYSTLTVILNISYGTCNRCSFYCSEITYVHNMIENNFCYSWFCFFHRFTALPASRIQKVWNAVFNSCNFYRIFSPRICTWWIWSWTVEKKKWWNCSEILLRWRWNNQRIHPVKVRGLMEFVRLIEMFLSTFCDRKNV